MSRTASLEAEIQKLRSHIGILEHALRSNNIDVPNPSLTRATVLRAIFRDGLNQRQAAECADCSRGRVSQIIKKFYSLTVAQMRQELLRVAGIERSMDVDLEEAYRRYRATMSDIKKAYPDCDNPDRERAEAAARGALEHERTTIREFFKRRGGVAISKEKAPDGGPSGAE